VVYLNNPTHLSSRKKRNLRKFKGNYLLGDQNNLNEIYDLIKITLENYHGVSPTHSFKELNYLIRNFPNNIELFSAVAENKIFACAIVYKYKEVWHTQYLASSELGRKIGALDSLLVLISDKAKDAGCTHLSFGISSENNGKVLNDGLFNYKQEFGATARLNLTLELTK
jgi:lipid II:glycine glycyltransferase (peptidoglycan interpeptide bridge formation enzyme)